MPIDFPSSPTTGQKYTYNGIVYTFTGTTWTASANISQYSDPILTGAPTAPASIPPADSSTRLATTAFVQALIAAIPPPPPQFPTGTLMLFQQSASPPTWTKQTGHDDKSLRVVSGAADAGGVQPFSTVFGRTSVDATTLDTNTLPSHAHGVADPTHGHGLGDPTHGHGIGDPGHSHGAHLTGYFGDPTALSRVVNLSGAGSYEEAQYLSIDGAGTGIWTGGAYTGQWVGGAGTGIGIYGEGASWGHSHGFDIRVLYVDIIIARKD